MHRDEHNNTNGRCHTSHLKIMKEKEWILVQAERLETDKSCFQMKGRIGT